jgi:hypothetical protein
VLFISLWLSPETFGYTLVLKKWAHPGCPKDPAGRSSKIVCGVLESLPCAIFVRVFIYTLNSQRGLGIFLFTTVSRTALGPTQPPVQWVLGALFLGVKRPVREADHLPQSSADVKECVELYIRSPNTPSWRVAQFRNKHRDNFNFTFTLSRDLLDENNDPYPRMDLCDRWRNKKSMSHTGTRARARIHTRNRMLLYLQIFTSLMTFFLTLLSVST